MNHRLLQFGWIVLLMTVSACGGSSGSGGPGSGLEVQPEEARASESVLLIGDFEEGDTVCFVRKEEKKAGRGCGFPSMLENLTEGDGEDGRRQARVTLPGLIFPGKYEIKVARGEEFSEGTDFTVLSGQGAASEPSGTATQPEGGEVIVPEGTPPTDTGDSAPADTAPQALSASLEGTEALNETSLGMVKVHYSATGSLKALYVYGPFTSDADCDDHLAIDPSGNDLNPGSPNYAKYEAQFSGEVCDAAAGNCRGFAPQAGDGVHCRIDLLKASGSFYARMRQKESTYTLIAEGADGEIKTATKSFTAPEPSLTPRVEVLSNKPYIAVEFSFYRAAGEPGFTMDGGCEPDPAFTKIVNRYADGSGLFRQRCRLKKAETAISLTVPGVGSAAVENVKVVLGAPSTKLKKGAMKCTNPDDSTWGVDCAGHIKLYGEVERTYEVRNDATGDVLSSGQTPWARSMTLSVRGPKGFMQEAKYTEVRTIDVTSSQAVFENVARDYAHSFWKLSVLDFDGLVHDGATVSAPYEAKLEVVASSSDWSYEFSHDTCDKMKDTDYSHYRTNERGGYPYRMERADEGECCNLATGQGCDHDSRDGVWNCRNYATSLIRVLTIKHAKSLEVRCTGEGESASYYDESIATDPNRYEASVVTKTFVVPGEKAHCQYILITHDGQWILWNDAQNDDQYGRPFDGYCDGADQSGSDADDTGY